MRTWYSLTSLMVGIGLLLAACGVPVSAPGTVPSATQASATTQPTEEPTAAPVEEPAEVTAVPSGEPAAETALLEWEGQSADGACLSLAILPSGEAQVGICGDEPKTIEFNTGPESEWAAVVSHFAPVERETPEGRLVFQGQGSASGPAWEDALDRWAWFMAQELMAGRTSAAGRTVLAWRLDELADAPGQCRLLVVLAYGYAYANTAPCDGNGPTELVAQGWLETAEWEMLHGWLANAARVEDAAGYLDAQGSASLTAEELTAEELTAWAAAVYDRLAE